MTFLAPIFFYVALGVAAGAIALHFIVTRQPGSSPLPTVRFIPTSQVRVTTVAPLPEDLLLLLVRVLAILLIGAALARPVIVPQRRLVARVLLADISRAVGRIQMVRDSASALLKQGDVLIVFDSAAHMVRGASDSAPHLLGTAREGRLSPALIAALRAASTMRDAADSIELVIISPLRANEMDGSTQAIRALWLGRVRLVPIPGAADSLAPAVGIAVRASADDPIALAASVNGIPFSDSTVRVSRGAPVITDSAWATSGRHTLVRWPAAGGPPGWVARVRSDTAAAIIAGEAALVFPLERTWQLDTTAHPTRITARWVDGAPAAVEYAVGAGCIRDIAVPVPTRGDLILRPAFARLLRALVAPCEVVSGGLGADSATIRSLAGTGALASRDVIRPRDIVSTPLVPWLLGAALLFVLIELLVRRGSAPLWTDVGDERIASPSEPGAAA